MKARQQGDCRFLPVQEIPKTAVRRLEKESWRVLALGEVTGHKHQIMEESVEIYEEPNGTLYLKADQPLTVQHEEHGILTLKPGITRMKRVREKDMLEGFVRKVQD